MYGESNMETYITICKIDQFRSVVSSAAQSCPTLCNPMDCSMPGLPVHHQLQEFTQTYVHGVSDAIQPSHLLLSPSPPALNLSQHQGLFQWVSSSHQVDKVIGVSASTSVLPMNTHDWSPLECTGCKIESQQEFAVCLRKLKQRLCTNLEGWDGEEMGEDSRRRGHMYTCGSFMLRFDRKQQNSVK